MKAFLLVSCFLGLAFVRADDCSLCVAFMQGTANILLSDDEIAQAKMLLQAEVCPQFENVQECKSDVEQWWGDITKAIIGGSDFGGRACAFFQLCQVKSFDNDECSACKETYGKLGEALNSDIVASRLISLLHSEKFCSQPGFSADEAMICIEKIDAFVPKALPVLANAMREGAAELCNKMYDNVCVN